jgi:hypothetical protein
MQNRILTAGTVFGALMAFMLWFAVQPANAQYITSKEKCDSELKNVNEMYAKHNLGPKVEKIVADLIKVLEDDCKAGRFDRADELENAIRGLLVIEN